MTTDESDALDRDLKLAFDALLAKPVFQIELQDWIDGKRDDDYRLILAGRMARTAKEVFVRPHTKG